MSPHESRLFVIERLSGGCGDAWQRLTTQHADGTGYRVILDLPELAALYSPGEPWSRARDLWAIGEGEAVAIFIPQSLYECVIWQPWHIWLVDTSTGMAEELDPGWEGGVALPSFSSDGDRIVYNRYDDVGSQVVTARRTTTTRYDTDVEVLFTPGEFGIVYLPVLSANGEVLVFLAKENWSTTSPADLYVYHLPTGRLRLLLGEPPLDLVSLSVSASGERVAYSARAKKPDPQPVYGINTDGTGLHMVTPKQVLDAVTISADGQWVVFNDVDAIGFVQSYRVPWVGGEPELIGEDYWDKPMEVKSIPVSADGNLHLRRKNFGGSVELPQPALLVRFGTRWLTTYGSEQPGQPLRCDVGGPPGAPFTLFGSLHEASQRTPFGMLWLEPTRLTVLGNGLVTGANNVTTVEFAVPDDSALEGVAYHFQALVWDGTTPVGGGLTERTTVTLHAED